MTLPMGFQVTLAGGILTADRGHLLVGGSPLTAMRLTRRAQEMLSHGRVTVTDAPSAHLAERLLATNLGLPDLRDVPRVAEWEITVVLPVRDRSEQLERALAAVQPLRCVVVDDASHTPDAVAEVAQRFAAELIRLPVNLGPAGARNAGLATVTTPYVAFVDSDVEVAASQLTSLARHFVDPAVSLVGPRVTGIARSRAPGWIERYDAAASSLTLGTKPGTVRPGAAVAWLPSACLVARTGALAGGFDADLRVGEDVDLVWRLAQDGHRVRYDPSIEVRHDARSTLRAWLGRKFAYGSGGAALAARHGNKLAPAVLTPAYAVAACAILLRSRWALSIAVGALLRGNHSIRAALPEIPGRNAVAARLAARGLHWTLRQESALLLRHWWPLAAAGAATSHSVRRALATSLLIDTLVGMGEHEQTPDGPAVLRMIAGRRLDDLAYGTGLWWGAIRQRSSRVLLPRSPRQGAAIVSGASASSGPVRVLRDAAVPGDAGEHGVVAQ